MAIPSDFAGLVAWHEGDSQTEGVGNPVATLVGLGGTANSQTQATAGYKPTLIAGANGFKAIQFDNTDDTILLSAGSSITARPLTVFISYAPRNATQAALRVLCGQSGNNWLIGPRSESGAGQVVHSAYVGSFIPGNPALGFAVPVVGSVNTYTLEQPSTGSTVFRIGGFQHGTTAAGTAPGVLRIGGTSVYSGEPAYADVYGLAVYNTALPAADRDAVEAYFAKFIYPIDPNRKVTQGLIEQAYEAGGIRATQVVAEQQYEAGGIRATQVVAEQQYEAGGIRVSQVCIELIYLVGGRRFRAQVMG